MFLVLLLLEPDPHLFLLAPSLAEAFALLERHGEVLILVDDGHHLAGCLQVFQKFCVRLLRRAQR